MVMGEYRCMEVTHFEPQRLIPMKKTAPRTRATSILVDLGRREDEDERLSLGRFGATCCSWVI